MVDLKQEIGQQAPFRSVEEQTLLNLLRTADCLDRAMQRMIRPYGVTATQYNVLRILRGAQPRGLTCSAIGERMITADPDVTRLVSRLKKLKLARQQRDRQDRRVVWTQISAEGLKLLSEMDPMIEKAPPQLLGHLSESDLNQLVRLLEAAREGCGDGRSQPQCDGKSREVSCDGKAEPPASESRQDHPACDGR